MSSFQHIMPVLNINTSDKNHDITKFFREKNLREKSILPPLKMSCPVSAKNFFFPKKKTVKGLKKPKELAHLSSILI